MEIPILIVVAALLIAMTRRGLSLSLPAWRGSLLLVLALCVQVYFVAFPPPGLTTGSATLIYLASQGLVAAFILLNRKITGLTLAALGLGLNALVVATNGAMPVSPVAVEAAGAESLSDPRHVEQGVHLRNEEMTDQTRLAPLADVIPIPPFNKVVSLGDLVLAVGLLWGAITILQGPREEEGSSGGWPSGLSVTDCSEA